MEKTLKHIFIAIAPNHISNFENIINDFPEKEFTILINPGSYKYTNDVWSKVFNGNINLNYNVSNVIKKFNFQLRKLQGYREFERTVSKWISFENYNFNYYYCNLDDILTNHFFNLLIDNKKTKHNFVVEDGILNYYYPKIDKSKLRTKKVIAEKILNLTFIAQKNHPTGINSEVVTAQFVRLPQQSINSNKSLKLPFEPIYYKPNKKTVLIIGQDIMHNGEYGLNYYKNKLEELFCAISIKHKGSKIVYKPHRNGDFKIAEEKLKKFFSEYKMYHSNIPIEKNIALIKPSFIYSFESSAILNIKLALSFKEVEIFILPYDSKGQKELLNIFQKIGVTVLQ